MVRSPPEMNETAFCIARIGEPLKTPDGVDVDFVSIELPDSDSVIDFLQKNYARFAYAAQINKSDK